MQIRLSWKERLKVFFSGTINVDSKIEKKESEISQASVKTTAEKPEAQIKSKKSEPLATDQTSALQLLHLLQKHGRLVDFLYENIDTYSDEEVGAGVRVVHKGCNKVLKDHIQLVAIFKEEEDTQITVEKNFDTEAIHLIGDVQGEPPYRGVLVHKGWKVNHLDLPMVTDKAKLMIVNPAEIEL
ncbi:DUF2760 domain-containing protein [Thiotrichales bacterium 19S11-10]|nr:DUF2760 domain-containing protein [Thiotrichales bacterium 19S11-10]MCF6807060.1 DUF2760 domain-containing protein [Thiotrichales bacterium 19S9-11]MCF6811029.1 DUF2760 domain-containing protein [Thiotrichales bacterium 19S9-12]